LTSAAREASSDRRKLTLATPVATETIAAMGNVDITIARHYWEFKCHTSSLNSHTRLIGRVPGDSIYTGMLTLVID
jgi:hypothetical protein